MANPVAYSTRDFGHRAVTVFWSAVTATRCGGETPSLAQTATALTDHAPANPARASPLTDTADRSAAGTIAVSTTEPSPPWT